MYMTKQNLAIIYLFLALNIFHAEIEIFEVI